MLRYLIEEKIVHDSRNEGEADSENKADNECKADSECKTDSESNSDGEVRGIVIGVADEESTW